MTLDEWYASASDLEKLVHRLACNPRDGLATRELLAALGDSQWLWRVPAKFSEQLEEELTSARWWAKDLTRYDAKSPGLGMVSAVLSFKRHLLAILGELKRLGA